jgi:hypothetical protein
MTLQINQLVKTPIGKGRVVGLYSILDMNQANIVRGVVVRLPINDATRVELKRDNCITPRAVISGVWSFGEADLEAAG